VAYLVILFACLFIYIFFYVSIFSVFVWFSFSFLLFGSQSKPVQNLREVCLLQLQGFMCHVTLLPE
jgi:hypothetical protein